MSASINHKKRLQVVFSDEAWNAIESVTSDANRDFEVGSVSYSDVINEMVLTSKVDLKALQAKRTDVRRSLRYIAAQDSVDLDSAIKALLELKSKTGKRGLKLTSAMEESSHG